MCQQNAGHTIRHVSKSASKPLLIEKIYLRKLGEDFVAGGGDEEGVFPLRTGFAVGSARDPTIFGNDCRANTRIDHGLNGKSHAFC